jgi:hypothetical protein
MRIRLILSKPTLAVLIIFGVPIYAPGQVADDPSVPAETSIAAAIQRAGNIEDEQERYRILARLAMRDDVDPDLRDEFERLLPLINNWANGREMARDPDGDPNVKNGYLQHFISGKARKQPDYHISIRKDSPLYPIWCYYWARIQIWVPIEYGGIWNDLEERGRYFDEARELLKVAADAYPENRIIGMHLGNPIPWPAGFEPDGNAPRWANLQREGLEKLTELIHWWIDSRQIEDGRFGGGWGDDVEMWRWWTAVLIGFQDHKIIEAQTKLTNGMLSQPHMKYGYSSKMTDVEHTAEDTSDTITPMLHLQPDNPRWQAKSMRLAELMRDKWTGYNERGFLQFKSTYFNVHEVDQSPERACDTVYHPRAVRPALLHWFITGDPELGTLFSSWMDTWVDAAAREERGKPAGVIPSAIHWPDGQVGGCLVAAGELCSAPLRLAQRHKHVNEYPPPDLSYDREGEIPRTHPFHGPYPPGIHEESTDGTA